jgi:prefoldin subunit 5
MSLQDEVNAKVAAIQAQLSAINDQAVSFTPVKEALTALADAIEALVDIGPARSMIDAIPDEQTVDLSIVKNGSAGLVQLLIKDSNFDGADQ